ncbi:MlaD family protein [Algoriphagus algorifonticola]|uniref:MlaD family protein n=1 Tax=Algoriphagus algorifonticola TaxID=2593007 RepID=UPI00119C9128|nr:MlaD family protein [Algoriphagus algorifonticola]
MKGKKKIEHTKLGALVIAGVLFLVFALYMIGKNQNIFGTSITLLTVVENVNGLVPGNNVRFQGMDVGTVKSIEMANDSTIEVSLLIKRKMQEHIKKNAATIISTDGLMGNKILHIVPQEGEAGQIEEGDVLFAMEQVGTEDMLKKLDMSGDYLQKTLVNLADITNKLNKSQAIWSLLRDTMLVENINLAVDEFRLAGRKATEMAQAGNRLLRTLEEGEGLVDQVFTDTILSANFSKSIDQILKTGEEAERVLLEAKTILNEIQEGKGAAGALLNDTLVRESLLNTIQNIESSTESFNQNMEALKHNFLLRGHFKRLEKRKTKELEQFEK